jgi:hypothetical protein
LATAHLSGGAAIFDLTGIAAGTYFIRVNDLNNDLLPSRIDDPTRDVNEVFNTMLRRGLMGTVADPAYIFHTHSKGQGNTGVVKYSDGTAAAPERHNYDVILAKATPRKIQIRVLGTDALLTEVTLAGTTHPSGSQALPGWMFGLFGSDNHGKVMATNNNCASCHGSLDTHPASHAGITASNGWCFNCHYGQGGDDLGFVDSTQ